MYLSPPGSLSHHVNISLECSEYDLSRLSPTNCGGKSPHLSLYHALCGWQELTIYTQLAAISPLATKSLSGPNPSSLVQKWHQIVEHIKFVFNSPSQQWCELSAHSHTTFALACPQGWSPFPELFHCLSLSFPALCFEHFSLLLPSRGLDSTTALLSSTILLG